MKRKPAILTLSEFLKLEGKHKKPVIVYFDGKEWANLTRNLKPTDQKPRRNNALTFTLSTLPGLEGGFVEIRCPVDQQGLITGADGRVWLPGKPLSLLSPLALTLPAIISVPSFCIEMGAFRAKGNAVKTHSRA